MKKLKTLAAFARGEVATTRDVRRLLQQSNIQSAQSVVRNLLRQGLVREDGWVTLPPTYLRRATNPAKRYVITQLGLRAVGDEQEPD